MSQSIGGNSDSPKSSIENEVDSSAADLLKSVLESTLAIGSSSITNEELQRLRNLVQLNSSSPLSIDEVAVMMVSVFLQSRFGDSVLGTSPDGQPKLTLENMSKTIAKSLCDDPTSSRRLTQFWKLLQESTL